MVRVILCNLTINGFTRISMAPAVASIFYWPFAPQHMTALLSWWLRPLYHPHRNRSWLHSLLPAVSCYYKSSCAHSPYLLEPVKEVFLEQLFRVFVSLKLQHTWIIPFPPHSRYLLRQISHSVVPSIDQHHLADRCIIRCDVTKITDRRSSAPIKRCNKTQTGCGDCDKLPILHPVHVQPRMDQFCWLILGFSTRRKFSTSHLVPTVAILYPSRPFRNKWRCNNWNNIITICVLRVTQVITW